MLSSYRGLTLVDGSTVEYGKSVSEVLMTRLTTAGLHEDVIAEIEGLPTLPAMSVSQ